MKIHVCDICYSKDKITETRKRVGFRGEVMLDTCKECEKLIPNKREEFMKFSLKILTKGEKNE